LARRSPSPGTEIGYFDRNQGEHEEGFWTGYWYDRHPYGNHIEQGQFFFDFLSPLTGLTIHEDHLKPAGPGDPDPDVGQGRRVQGAGLAAGEQPGPGGADRQQPGRHPGDRRAVAKDAASGAARWASFGAPPHHPVVVIAR
jgi:hypothetical protein